MKVNRRAGGSYADLQELEDTDRRDDGDQYARTRVASLTDIRLGTGHDQGVRVGVSNRGRGVGVNGQRQINYDANSYGAARTNGGLAGTDFTGRDGPSEELVGSGRGLGLENTGRRSSFGYSRYGSDAGFGRSNGGDDAIAGRGVTGVRGDGLGSLDGRSSRFGAAAPNQRVGRNGTSFNNRGSSFGRSSHGGYAPRSSYGRGW